MIGQSEDIQDICAGHSWRMEYEREKDNLLEVPPDRVGPDALEPMSKAGLRGGGGDTGSRRMVGSLASWSGASAVVSLQSQCYKCSNKCSQGISPHVVYSCRYVGISWLICYFCDFEAKSRHITRTETSRVLSSLEMTSEMRQKTR